MIERRAFLLRRAADTQALAAALARALPPGVLLFLRGDLGAGKTTFAQGMARGLGVEEPVISPTFILIREYPLPLDPGRPERFVHLDLYRLSGSAELPGLGLDEFLDDDALVVIEWPERGEGRLPEAEVEVTLRAVADHGPHEPRRVEILARAAAIPALRDLARTFEDAGLEDPAEQPSEALTDG